MERVHTCVVAGVALGCPELEKPRYGWLVLEKPRYGWLVLEKPRYGWLVRERPDMAVLGCNESSVVWRLTCNDNRWAGPTVNCSPPGKRSQRPIIIIIVVVVYTH